MNNIYEGAVEFEPQTAHVDQAVKPGAAWLQQYCLSRGYEVTVAGRHKMIESEVALASGHRLVPFDQDQTVLPERIASLVQTLVQNGFTTDRMVIIHEPPKDKMEVAQRPAFPERIGITPKNVETVKKVLITVAVAAGAIAVAAVTILAVVAVAIAILTVLLPILFLGLAAVGMVAGIDPMLVVVLEDDTWVQVASWDEE